MLFRSNRIIINQVRNRSFSAHFHSNIEIMYVKSGTAEITVGSERRLLTEGSIAVAESYVAHSLSVDEQSVLYVAIIPVIRIPDFSLAHRNLSFSESFLDACPESATVGLLFENYLNLSTHTNPMIGKGFAYIYRGDLHIIYPYFVSGTNFICHICPKEDCNYYRCYCIKCVGF